MARYTVDPETGEKTKVSGTNYIPPCLAKTAVRKKPIDEPLIQTDAEPSNETGNEEAM